MSEMITRAESYDYPESEGYAETVATLIDGRVMVIDTQYSAVYPRAKHSATCSQVTKMGGRCDCGLLEGVDVAALIIDARANGKRGPRPVVMPKKEKEIESTRGKGWCPKCQSYCYGDCEVVS